MSRLVVDASVAVKWFLSEAHSQHARSILDGDHDMLAPDLLIAEFGNVLWKRIRAGDITEEEAAAALNGLLVTPLQLRSSSALIVPALDIANRMQRSVYDALYLALAVTENARLVTADGKLFDALSATPLSQTLLWVGSLGKDGLPA